MFARIVLFVVFLFVCVSSLLGQTTDVILQRGWNPSSVALQHAGSESKWQEATYIENGKDVTKQVLDLKTGKDRKLAVGTIIKFPSSIVNTHAVDPQGKTLTQLCAENPTWNCRQVERANRIHSLRQKLHAEIRVPGVVEAKKTSLPAPPVKRPINSKKTIPSRPRPIPVISAILISCALIVFVVLILAREDLAPNFTWHPPLIWIRFQSLLQTCRHKAASATRHFHFRRKYIWYPLILVRRHRRQRNELYAIAQRCVKNFHIQRNCGEVYPHMYLLSCRRSFFSASSKWNIRGNRQLYPKRSIEKLQEEADDLAYKALHVLGQTSRVSSEVKCSDNKIVIKLRRI